MSSLCSLILILLTFSWHLLCYRILFYSPTKKCGQKSRFKNCFYRSHTSVIFIMTFRNIKAINYWVTFFMFDSTYVHTAVGLFESTWESRNLFGFYKKPKTCLMSYLCDLRHFDDIQSVKLVFDVCGFYQLYTRFFKLIDFNPRSLLMRWYHERDIYFFSFENFDIEIFLFQRTV